MKISVVIITKNEAERIGACIQSVLPFSDEILVLDSFSEDDTKQRAEGLGARVVQRTFEGYGATKNFANQLTSGDYIFSIDADEVVDNELCEAILAVKAEKKPAGMYVVKRRNNYCGSWIEHGGWNPDVKPRFWRKEVAEWDLAEVHEKLQIQPGTEIIRLPGNLLHYSYRTREEHLGKIKSYSRKGAFELKRSGKKPGRWKQFTSPAVRWIRDYFFKLGFLDGAAGLRIANLTAYEVYEKYRLFFEEP